MQTSNMVSNLDLRHITCLKVCGSNFGEATIALLPFSPETLVKGAYDQF